MAYSRIRNILIFSEFNYEAGNKCDPTLEEEDEDLEENFKPRNPAPTKKTTNAGALRPQQVQPQIQYRPQLAQY